MFVMFNSPMVFYYYIFFYFLVHLSQSRVVCRPWLTFHIFDFFTETAEPKVPKLDKK